ncbi:DUF6544 family protein [Aeromicrobium choanae]|uniref:Uncharacterized protein n=1 Tax=Aeromicrobium choanae TaxID=1736691 RepID=A0A1T4YS78_9ACTN|nr:DUF6544 family protein [Aeromicrobium choanae]SKB04121.1 hypothetical protein SAMN06295964_0470 [Aeromicrobium choanae]
MTNLLRWTVVALVTVHGLIHLLGAAERFGWADDPTLEKSTGLGLLWLVAAVLLLVTALFAALGRVVGWWLLAVVAAVVSQVAILTSWDVSGSGTVVNVFLLVVAAYSFLLRGPFSFHAQWHQQVQEALAQADALAPVITEEDLDGLPAPVAAYVRSSGAVGRPRPTSVRAEFTGRIRTGPDAPWMDFAGKQVNTFGADPRRIFLMEASRYSLPVLVLHGYAGARASMRAKVLSVATVLDASGPELDQGETVTVFNDLVVLTPGAIVGAPIRWTPLDDRQVRGEFTNGRQTVTAVLTFDGDRLVNFVSDDRFRASEDGTEFVPQTWSTPLAGHTDDEGHHVVSSGVGRWRDPRGWFTYVEIEFEDVDLDPVRSGRSAGARAPLGRTGRPPRSRRPTPGPPRTSAPR